MTNELIDEDESDSPPLLLEGVRKAFGTGEASVEALRGVSLRVHEGELVAIMGASGSGKSTLLHAAAGLTEIDGGSVQIAGQDISTLSDGALTRFRRSHIGIVFQSFNLIPSLSAEANVRLPSLDKVIAGERVPALLDEFGLSGRRAHKPSAMSGGEQQRVAIARALINDPAVLFADEPTGSLDSQTGQRICELLRNLCDRQRRTILMVTHEPQVAMWADRIAVMRDGQLLTEFRPGPDRDAKAVADTYQSVLDEGGVL